MRFNFRIRVANLTFFAMISRTQRLEGVTSLQKDGKHFVMFDLEKCTLQEAENTLKRVQRKYHLSDIFIVSDAEKSFRAWCFSKVDFVTFLKILLDVRFLDWNFFYWTVKRGKATLRTNCKKGRMLQRVVSVLRSFDVPIPTSCEKVVYDTGLTKRGLAVLLGD
jgi:hypothetical protein